MPIVNRARRLLIEHLADNINELVLGFDGSLASINDAGAGRPVVKLTPTVSVLSEGSILIQAKVGQQYAFDDTLKEVVVQHKAADGTYTPIARFNCPKILKTDTNEFEIHIVMEVV